MRADYIQKIKKVQSFLLPFVVLVGVVFFSEISYAENISDYEGKIQKFQVSAYYSPLPNQKKYVSGSYQADLRMNGNGIHGADGTPVYVGMISAPRKYAFGTQIYIPGFGVGTVHDRGGAIYASKGYDRLDMWFGKGDAGRVRALQWGRQTVDGKILSKNISAQMNISTAEIPRSSRKPEISVSQKEKKAKKVPSDAMKFSRNFSRGDRRKDVQKIQKFLKSQGVFEGETSKYYGPKTENAVFLFQKKIGILKSWKDTGAGNWGPKTRRKANSIFFSSGQQKPEISKTKFSRNFSRGDRGEEVQKIQKFLKSKGGFEGETSEYYGPKTENAVFLFQKKTGILKSWKDAGAGNWGPKTRKKANSLL